MRKWECQTHWPGKLLLHLPSHFHYPPIYIYIIAKHFSNCWKTECCKRWKCKLVVFLCATKHDDYCLCGTLHDRNNKKVLIRDSLTVLWIFISAFIEESVLPIGWFFFFLEIAHVALHFLRNNSDDIQCQSYGWNLVIYKATLLNSLWCYSNMAERFWMIISTILMGYFELMKVCVA